MRHMELIQQMVYYRLGILKQGADIDRDSKLIHAIRDVFSLYYTRTLGDNFMAVTLSGLRVDMLVKNGVPYKYFLTNLSPVDQDDVADKIGAMLTVFESSRRGDESIEATEYIHDFYKKVVRRPQKFLPPLTLLKAFIKNSKTCFEIAVEVARQERGIENALIRNSRDQFHCLLMKLEAGTRVEMEPLENVNLRKISLIFEPLEFSLIAREFEVCSEI